MTGESFAYVSEAPSVMAESSREVTGTVSVKGEPSCPDMDQPLEQTDQDATTVMKKRRRKWRRMEDFGREGNGHSTWQLIWVQGFLSVIRMFKFQTISRILSHEVCVTWSRHTLIFLQRSAIITNVYFENCDSVYLRGYTVALLVQTVRYNPEGRGLYSRWCDWNFSLTS